MTGPIHRPAQTRSLVLGSAGRRSGCYAAPVHRGLLLIGIGVVMVVFDLVAEPRFTLAVSGLRLPLGIPMAILGALYWLSARLAEPDAPLSDTEIRRWGTALEQATPRIVALADEGWASLAIAEAVAKESGIPVPVLLRYLLALRRHVTPPRT